MDGNVHTFKARLVAKGFTQTHGIDYDETFSLVAMLKSIRILMAISAYFNYEIWQMDQASRSWNLHFDERIKEFGFAKSEFEPCVYTKFSGSIVTFLVLYVDDILLIGNDIPTLQSVKSWLSKCFQMKDLGEAAYILGIKLYKNRSKRLIGLSQSTYIDKVRKKFRMDESKKGYIPMQHGIVPDVAYSVSVTSRYQQNPGEPHWVAVKNILKYLRRTKDMFLVFGGSEDEISVIGYSDASFQTDRDYFRSQSGYVFTLNGRAISWKSSKQDTIADSTTEAEYIAASDVAKEAVWLRNFLSDLRVIASVSRPIDIFCDNSGAVAQAKEPREHHKSRHVLRKYHLIREIIGRGDVRICKIPTEDNVADPLTKPLARVKHEAHANSIGMQYLDTKMIEVKNIDIKTAIEAYKRGPDNSSELYMDLRKYPPDNFDDVRARTLAHMRIEDDAIFRRKHSNERKTLGAQKLDLKQKRVNKIENSRQESNNRLNRSSGTAKELVNSLRKIDATVRWPKKPENPNKDKDQTQWCEFHGDHGHKTDECFSLKKEIAYLKSNGHLKDIIPDETKRPASPVHTKVVNCITGGSEVCGLTYSAAKRHAREGTEGHPIPDESRTTTKKELDAATVTFDQDDLLGVYQKHHDALVIQLTIENCLTKRVLVDGGSSANAIFADTLKIMGIE
ncbi:hypothetical protein OSB04_006706 [Centaurea solstitialis]|uniref:Reverse transcriptase Ty1/copia-type domain-containing protein n=1 Tax=Centaurea solstitialis TaxID=347529 RepID=A0AA38WSU7_9ASTR|nr:hypothetical protein OSB04_006706 [Centaurea solstitialis]